MGKIKTIERQLMNMVAGQFLAEQEDGGDYYDAYLKLVARVEEDETNNALIASHVVDVWQGIEDWTVDMLIDQLEGHVDNYRKHIIKMNENPVPAFIKDIDWKLLKEQKDDVLESISDLEMESKEAGSAGEEGLMKKYNQQAESLEGIINLIDGLQDYAVDTLGMSEKDVYNFKEDMEDNELTREDLEGWTTHELAEKAIELSLYTPYDDAKSVASNGDRSDLIKEILNNQ